MLAHFANSGTTGGNTSNNLFTNNQNPPNNTGNMFSNNNALSLGKNSIGSKILLILLIL